MVKLYWHCMVFDRFSATMTRPDTATGLARHCAVCTSATETRANAAATISAMTAALLHELPLLAAQRTPDARALTYGAATLNYGELSDAIGRCAHGLLGLGLQRGERGGIYLEKRFETVIAAFGASAAGLVFVPVNPILKAEQVRHILADCNVRVLLTSPERLAGLLNVTYEQVGDHWIVKAVYPLDESRKYCYPRAAQTQG